MEDTIEHIVQTMLTVRMVRPIVGRKQLAGIQTLDLKSKEELTKPWQAIMMGHKRRKIGDFRRYNWLWSAWLWCGLILSVGLNLIVSVCFLLTGVGLNTIAYPKLRWFPDKWSIYGGYLQNLNTPQQVLVDLDWPIDLHGATPVVVENLYLSPLAQTLAGTDIYGSFVRGCDWAALIDYDKWFHVDGFMARISSSGNLVTSATQSIDQVRQLESQLRATGPRVVQMSQGMLGPVVTTSAQLTTSCSLSNTTVSSPIFGRRGPSSLGLDLPYDGLYGGFSISCLLDFKQASLRMQLITADTNHVFISYFHDSVYSKEELDPLGFDERDGALLDKLVQYLNGILPIMDRATPGLSFVNVTSLIADRTISRKIAQNKTTPTDVPHVMTPMVAYLAQQAL